MQMSNRKSNLGSLDNDRDDDRDDDRHQDRGNDRHEDQGNDRVKHDDHSLSMAGIRRDEIVVSTSRNDVLTGTPRGDTIVGRDGDDRIFGLGGNDNIDGGKGNDLIDGGDGNDRLDGNKGDDVLIGGAGDDYIDGGPKGHDTAVYSGNFADYTLSFSAGPEDSEGQRITVTDIRDGSPEGTDTLRRIEVIKFADGEYRDGEFHPIGGNTPATIGDPTVSNVAEDLNITDSGKLVASGTISIFDPDLAQAFFLSSVIPAEGSLGTLVLQPDGSYTYSVANSDVQFLGAGDTKIESFTVASADGTTKVVSFTITGSNDAAVIGIPNVSTLTEDFAVSGANLTVTGTIAVFDADAGQSGFQTAVVPVGSTLGTLSLNANGNYIYSVANSAVQYLGADAPPKVESFTISSLDGTARTVSFTIFGANDAAAIGAPTVSSVNEDANVNAGGYLSAAGSIPVSDADTGEAGFQTTVTPVGSPLGALALDASGAYTYTVDNSAVQFLGAGATQTDTFQISSIDGTSSNVSFIIIGTNDAAVIDTPSVSPVTEDLAVTVDGDLTATGSISVFDPDAGESGFRTTVGPAAGNLGTLLLAADGSYTYSVANSAVQFLGEGTTATDSFTVTSLDGTTQSVIFTINGTNDAAVIGAPSVSSVTEDTGVNSAGNLTATGSISIFDADAGQTGFIAAVAAGSTLGTLALESNGAYTYTVANSAVQFLGAGETATDTFTVTSIDGTTKSVSFTINSDANDAAVIGAPTFSTVTEDVGVSGGMLSVTGSISISDQDAGQAGFQTPANGVGSPLGSLALETNGSYTYSVANSAAQHLGAGATATDTFAVTSIDGTTRNVSFTINGVNDAPVVGAQVVAAREGGAGVSANALATASDADDNTTLSVSAVPASLPAGVSYNATTRVFSLNANNPAYDHLAAGEHQSVTVNYQVSDGIAATPASIVFDIEGSNDSAVISGLSGPLNYTVGDAPVLVDNTLTVTDADNGLLTSARVLITNGFKAGNDNLGFDTALANDANDPAFDPNAPGNLQVTGSYDGATGVLTFTGLASLAEYESILESVRFNTSTPGVRTVSYTVNDGTVDSAPVTTSNVSLEDLTTTGFRIPGEAAGDASGFGMRGAGDFNGDGYDDIIIGAPFSDGGGLGAGSGRSYVVFGGPGVFPDTVPLSSIDGSNGFRLTGEAADDRSGWAVSDAGDVNGDGFDDVVVSAILSDANGTSSGAVYVVFGKSGSSFADMSLAGLAASDAGFRISGTGPYDAAGITVNAAGDIDGDGFDDLIIGVPYATPNPGLYGAGAGYVIFGKANGFTDLSLSSLGVGDGFRISGLAAYDYAGTRMDGVGDVNGDGFDDLIIAAVGYSATDPGAAYVVFGKDSGFAPDLNLAALDGSNGFKISGAAAGDHLGWGLSDAGDLNGDGYADVIVSSQFARVGGVASGAAYVVFGTDQGYAAELNVSTLDGGNGFRIAGAAQGAQAGFSVSGIGDFNGDGYDDVIVGAPGAKTGELVAGQSYVVFGKASGFAASLDLSTLGGSDGFKLSGVANGDDSGYQVSAAGDVNGDGFADIAVSSSRASPNGETSAGETYVIFGATLGAKLVGVETYLGGSGNDTLTSIGIGSNEAFIGGQGDDTIFGIGGVDAYSAGAGNDSIHLGVAGVFGSPASEFIKINGGSGFDTLALDGSGVTLDLTASGVSGRVQGIERIDLGGGGNTLALDLRDVLNLSDTSNQLFVKGEAGDSVSSAGQGWLPELDGLGNQVQVQDPLDGLLATYNSYTPGGAAYIQGMANLLIDVDLLAAGSTSVIG